LGNLREAASVASRILLRMACEETWPAKRRPQKDVEKIKKAERNLDNLEVDAKLERLYRRRKK